MVLNKKSVKTPIKQTEVAVSRKSGFEQYLLDRKYITKKQLGEIHIHQAEDKLTFEEAVLKSKLATEEKLARAKAEYFQLPYIDLRTQKLSKEAISAFSKETLENYQILPFSKEKDVLKVAVVNPADLRALEALEFLAEKKNWDIELYLASASSYREVLEKRKTIGSEVGEALQSMKQSDIVKKVKSEQKKEKESEGLQKLASDDPITRIVNVIIEHAIQARSSDIHIEPQEHDLRIRYRVDGVLQSSLVVPKIVHPAIVSRIKILSNLKIDEQRLPQDGRFHMNVDKKSIDFRVSSLPTVNGEKVVMRILDKSGGVPRLEDLGFTGWNLKKIQENIDKPHGIMLVTGPTGSGKSTTLYSVLNIKNKIGVNIVTLEDPVEYYIDGINQSQINPDIGLTFASGLRSILRQDPNIIMVGEIRDMETAELAVHAALTGHLVFSTLHTNDAIGAIPRLLDMGIEPFLLTASANIVVAQRLVRRICDTCRKDNTAPDDIKKMLQDSLKEVNQEHLQGVDLNNIKTFIGGGCEECAGSGYQGRVAIAEVLPLSDEIKEMILSKVSAAKLEDQAKQEGMIKMQQDGMIKVLKGLTTMEEVMRVTKE